MKMKANYYIILICSLLIKTQLSSAQQILELNFSGTHYNNQIILDSIHVKNMNRNSDTILYWPDTTLIISYTVGLDENSENVFNISEVYPNPVTNGNTSFDVYTHGIAKVHIMLSNLQGNVIANYSDDCNQGKHLFEIYNLRQGIYFLSVTINNNIITKKVLSLESNTGLSQNAVITKINNTATSFKKGNNKSSFWFEPGDTLRYLGYSITPELVNGSDVLESAPVLDTINLAAK